ncbi:MAG: hypothetical protein U0164_24020 [Gemmatimonadaceae bacterium]
MTLPLLTVMVALAVVAILLLALRRHHTERTLGWRLLAHAGLPLALVGAVFVVRYWTPTRGPYLANVRYPFGDFLAAWAVSFGFAWIALGLLFPALAVLAPIASADRRGARIAWLSLMASWVLCWAPHGIIGLAVALGGMDERSVTRYSTWASRPSGAITLAADSALLLLHFVLAVSGFVLAGRDVWSSAATRGTTPIPMA